MSIKVYSFAQPSRQKQLQTIDLVERPEKRQRHSEAQAERTKRFINVRQAASDVIFDNKQRRKVNAAQLQEAKRKLVDSLQYITNEYSRQLTQKMIDDIDQMMAGMLAEQQAVLDDPSQEQQLQQDIGMSQRELRDIAKLPPPPKYTSIRWDQKPVKEFIEDIMAFSLEEQIEQERFEGAKAEELQNIKEQYTVENLKKIFGKFKTIFDEYENNKVKLVEELSNAIEQILINEDQSGSTSSEWICKTWGGMLFNTNEMVRIMVKEPADPFIKNANPNEKRSWDSFVSYSKYLEIALNNACEFYEKEEEEETEEEETEEEETEEEKSEAGEEEQKLDDPRQLPEGQPPVQEEEQQRDDPEDIERGFEVQEAFESQQPEVGKPPKPVEPEENRDESVNNMKEVLSEVQEEADRKNVEISEAELEYIKLVSKNIVNISSGKSEEELTEEELTEGLKDQPEEPKAGPSSEDPLSESVQMVGFETESSNVQEEDKNKIKQDSLVYKRLNKYSEIMGNSPVFNNQNTQEALFQLIYSTRKFPKIAQDKKKSDENKKLKYDFILDYIDDAKDSETAVNAYVAIGKFIEDIVGAIKSKQFKQLGKMDVRAYDTFLNMLSLIIIASEYGINKNNKYKDLYTKLNTSIAQSQKVFEENKNEIVSDEQPKSDVPSPEVETPKEDKPKEDKTRTELFEMFGKRTEIGRTNLYDPKYPEHLLALKEMIRILDDKKIKTAEKRNEAIDKFVGDYMEKKGISLQEGLNVLFPIAQFLRRVAFLYSPDAKKGERFPADLKLTESEYTKLFGILAKIGFWAEERFKSQKQQPYKDLYDDLETQLSYIVKRQEHMVKK
jgi:hypothetical protein